MAAASTLFGVLPTAADSARVVAHVYAVSLSALVPLSVAGIAAVALRKSQAAGRAPVWRAAVIAILVVYVGGLLPVHQIAWVVPAGLAMPIVALGRMQVGQPIARLLAANGLASSGESQSVRLLLAVYVIGILAVLLPMIAATMRLAAESRRAIPARGPRLARILDEAHATVGGRRSIDLLISRRTNVPMTWGMIRPVIFLPERFLDESDDRLRAILLHELTHVRSTDAAFAVMSRIACAILWFHPAAWWIDRRLRADCEVACDDRVLAMGVRQSDYAELLVDACDRVHDAPALALAICQRAGLRQRLQSILDPARDRRRASRFAGALAMTLTMVVALPASVVQLAPTRSVLDSLMRDQRWESRAYAVLGLAQRPDSIEIARSAASTDPDPKVRAWARYAISQEPVPAADRQPSSTH